MYSFNKIKSIENNTNSQPIDVESIKSFQPNCIRNKTNWSTPESQFHFENAKFDKNIMKSNIENYSPKLYYLLEHIRQLDTHDIESGKFLQKHFIFTDLQSSDYGAKMLASGLLAYGYKLGFGKLTNGDLKYKTLEELEETAYNNFFLLTSVQLFDKPMKTKDKRKMLQLFNSRPTQSLNLWDSQNEINNVYGKYIRFIILDSEFKEGIDLLDIKYVHIFEPPTQSADQTQIIGRATRAYGQCGLKFTPNIGWPLHVYIYDIIIPQAYQSTFLNSKSLSELYQKIQLFNKGLDINLPLFANYIQNLTIFGSVDYELNKILQKPNSLTNTKSNPVIYSLLNKINMKKLENMKMGGNNDNLPVKLLNIKNKNIKRIRDFDSQISFLNNPNISYQSIRDLIKKQFLQYTWKHSDLNNNCQNLEAIKPRISKYPTIEGQESLYIPSSSKSQVITGGNNNCESKLISLNPTQKFIPNYFIPSNPIKGMLLWHGTGTGKTCIAVATATNAFENEKYTILWVTRSSLKTDFYKNIFDQSCHQGFREKIAKCELELPNTMESRLKLLSNSWQIPPLSYKQFTNLIAKKNKFYNQLIDINGLNDPLHKTLIIIDEAHKLFSKNDLMHQEMPDMNELKAAIHHSYNISGKDSVRLLLMTATPIGETTMELIQLINLCKKSNEQIPEIYEDFAVQYLDDSTGDFTMRGRQQYLNDIAGKISYLNRENDIQLFAQPIIEKINVPLLTEHTNNPVKTETKNEIVIKYENKTKKLNRVAQQLKSIIDHVKKYDLSFFKKKLQGCDVHYKDSLMNTTCNQLVNQHLESILQTTRPFFSKYRLLYDRVEYEKKHLQEKHLKELTILSELEKEQKESFSKSMISVLLNKCGQEEIDSTKQYAQLELNPKIMKLNESIYLLKEETKDLEMNFDKIKNEYEKQINFLRGLPENERQHILQEPGFRKQFDVLRKEKKFLEEMMLNVNLKKKERINHKKEILQELKQNWLEKANMVFNGRKKTRKNNKKVTNVSKKALSYTAGSIKNKICHTNKTLRKIPCIVDSLELYHKQLKGGTNDVDILTEKLTNTKIENVFEDIDEFVKKIVRNHIIEINNELKEMKNKMK